MSAITKRANEKSELTPVIKRLRADKAEQMAVAFKDGATRGTKWARAYATVAQLQRLSDAESELAFSDEDAMVRLAELIDPNVDWRDYRDFWESNVGEEVLEAYPVAEAAFAFGFVGGAMELWRSIEDDVCNP